MILTFTLGNAVNLLLGILVGFLISAIVSVLVISRKIKKINKDEKIRAISLKNYEGIFERENKLKDKLFLSLKEEVKDVSMLIYPNSDYPLYELSFNEIITALKIIHDRLNKIIDNPLFSNLKDIKISSLISMKKAADPFIKIYKNKLIKILSCVVRFLLMILNIFNPIYYTRLIIQHYVKKKGKKEMGIMSLDLIGNVAYDIYKDSNKKDL